MEEQLKVTDVCLSCSGEEDKGGVRLCFRICDQWVDTCVKFNVSETKLSYLVLSTLTNWKNSGVPLTNELAYKLANFLRESLKS